MNNIDRQVETSFFINNAKFDLAFNNDSIKIYFNEKTDMACILNSTGKIIGCIYAESRQGVPYLRMAN